MNNKQLCDWLRENSSGAYRPCAEAAEVIENLISALKAVERWDCQGDSIKDGYDEFYGAGAWDKLVNGE